MRKIVLLYLIAGTLLACNKDDEPKDHSDTELIGDWKLIALYADPGDGNGSFAAVDSDKTISFHQDETISSNGNLCSMSIEASNPTSGTFSLVDSTFLADCNPDYEFPFEQQGNILLIYYPCIEPCQAKYKKQ